MKQTHSRIICILIVISQIIGCQKKPVVTPPVDKEVCRITQMTYAFKYGSSNFETAIFKYNDIGNPISITVSHPATGNTNKAFFYDQYNRLTEFIDIYTDVSDYSKLPPDFLFEKWIRYVYADNDPSSLPVRDTSRTLGKYKDGKLESTSYEAARLIVYDSQKRSSYGYGYDANGNLVLPNVVYDDNKNFRQTNKVWMLLDRNYSKNNPFNAAAYNNAGYPILFAASDPMDLPLDNFLGHNLNFLTMDYSCSMQSAQ